MENNVTGGKNLPVSTARTSTFDTTGSNDQPEYEEDASKGDGATAVLSGSVVSYGTSNKALTQDSFIRDEKGSYGSTAPVVGTAGIGCADGKDPWNKDPESQPLIPSDSVPRKLSKYSSLLVYISHFLSAWGDRMWTFAVGLFLVNITPDSLQLTAIFGLTMGTSVFLLGPVVGDWVDSTARLKAARRSLLAQNILVVLCTVVIYCFLMYKEELLDFGEWTRYVTYGIIIVLASAANLAAIANTIAVERDWIVEICAQDENRLASMTATMRAIDLCTQILAPVATGQVMTYAGVSNGAIFIGSWNVCSVVVEYYLIWKVYKTVPALQKRKDFIQKPLDAEAAVDKNRTDSFTSSFHRSLTTSQQACARMVLSNTGEHEKPRHSSDRPTSSEKEMKMKTQVKKKKSCTGSCRIMSSFTIILEGWKTYSRYEVMLSGLALACLYMTVLGFDNVTIGYAKIQGLSESVVGIMMGGGGLFGIFGTFLYPVLRRRVGLPRTGLLALAFQNICLSLCVVSIWLPGSPFDLFGDEPVRPVNCTALTSVIVSTNVSTPPSTLGPVTSAVSSMTDGYFPASVECPESDNSLVSVLVLMTGIITARTGLWIADLTISQMFMETVKEQERGVVNGVQSSINQLMDMIKFGLVVALPLAHQFGLLIILSAAFILGGCIMYLIFICRLPAHLFTRKSVKGET